VPRSSPVAEQIVEAVHPRDFIAEASGVLAGSLDYETTLATVARLAVPQLADWCAVDVIEDSNIRRLTITHVDPEKLALAHELQQKYSPRISDTGGVARVLRSGKPELTPEITDAMLAMIPDAELQAMLRKIGIVSSMVVPLVARDQVLGAISFVSAESGRHFTAVDLAHAEELAGRAALAVDNARLYREAQEARRQLSFVAEASKALTDSLDYRKTLATIARLALPVLADYCIVDMVEDDGRITHIESAHVDQAKEAVLAEIRRRYPPKDGHPVTSTIQSRTSKLMTVATDREMEAAAHDDEHMRLMREINTQSWMIVPMIARGRLLGTITLATAESGRRYTSSDLRLAEELAGRAALAIDNARLYGEAQQAIHEREVLLSVASHELKNPLAALLGYAQLVASRLRCGATVTERDQQGLTVVIEQAERLNKMLDALLDLSRIEQGQLVLECGSFDLNALAHRMLDEATSMTTQHTLAITSPDVECIVYGDELRIEQVVRNLISNAVKYSPYGGRIEVRVEQKGERTCLAVTDQGIGIPEEAQSRLFQRYYRASNASTHSIRGIGVGLYVVKEIVTLHGGTVEVQSADGAGSTFTICIPSNAC
jgi:signal transduction histidine kinase